MYGYVVTEIDLPRMNKPSEGLVIRVRGGMHGKERRPVAALAPNFLRAGNLPFVRPRPDLDAPVNKIAGSIHRFGRELPPAKPGRMTDFLNFAKFLIRKKFPVLPADTTYSVDHWLSKYTKAEQAQFRELIRDSVVVTAKRLRNKSFIKDEPHNEPKMPRIINAYTDAAKAICGDIQHVLDEAVYKLPFSVKHMNVNERPRAVAEKFGLEPVDGTDFSAMEAHHEGVRAKIRIYWKKHVGQNLPFIDEYMKIVRAKSEGINVSEFKDVIVQVVGRLMSGDCSTSSDNFVLNICLILYMLWKSVYPDLPLREAVEKVWEWPMFAEGDDGIFKHFDILPGLVEELGLAFKKDDYPHFGMASFCGIIADPDELINITDPRKVLADFPVLSRRYMACSEAKMRQLMRAKAMSYLVCYSGCPIIDPYCRYVLRATRGVDVRSLSGKMGYWDNALLEQALTEKPWLQARPISPATRRLVERVYQISNRTQMLWESEFETRDVLMPLDVAEPEAPPKWMEFSRDYVDQVGWTPRHHEALDAGELGLPHRIPQLSVLFEPSHC